MPPACAKGVAASCFPPLAARCRLLGAASLCYSRLALPPAVASWCGRGVLARFSRVFVGPFQA